jgi:sigma-E factor negative regulatory protein RseC
MREQGIVTRIISPGVVEISFRAAAGCAGCGICHPNEAGGVSIEADNTAGAGTGDAVEVDIAGGGVLKTSAIVYLLPVFSLLAGYAAGSFLATFIPAVSGETGGIAGSVVLFAVSFLIVKGYDRRAGGQPSPRATVTRILPPDEAPQADCEGFRR